MQPLTINHLNKGDVMRVNSFKSFMLILLFSGLFIGTIFAQPPAKRGGPNPERGDRICNRISDLTEDQQEQIEELKTAHLKEVLPLRNKIQEKRAHLQTISTGDKVNMDEVNKTIEEISAIKLQIAKKRAAHRQQIRNLLTEEQRVEFDSMPSRHGMRHDGPRGKRDFGGRGECRRF